MSEALEAAARRCSDLSTEGDEPLAGTAPEHGAWLMLEHGLPWGRDALAESRLAAGVASELAARAKEAFVKVVLVRPALRAPSVPPRRAFAAHAGAGLLAELPLESDEDLLSVDLAALARGDAPAGARPVAGRMTLVCTNGRRDACCAFHGRRAAVALATVRPEETWECTHIGGHRFAATLVSFPEGACFGRLDEAAAPRVVERLHRGELDLGHLRGFVGRRAAVQAAEALVREREGLTGLRDVAGGVVVPGPIPATVEVRLDAGGREHRLVLREEHGDPRVVSCGGEPEPQTVWHELRSW